MVFFVYLQAFDPGMAIPAAAGVVVLGASFAAAYFLNNRFSTPQSPKPAQAAPQMAAQMQVQNPQPPLPEKTFDVSKLNFSTQNADQSIVKTIQELLKNSTPEEEVVNNLKDLGLDEKSAKKLMLLAQSDAIEVFKEEIEQITKKNVQAQLLKIQEKLGTDPDGTYKEKIAAVKKNLGGRLEKAEKTTKKSKEEIAKGLVELSSQFEEMIMPDLEKKPEPKKETKTEPK